MGAKKQTIGYKYFMSLHMGLGRGPLNQIAEIRVGNLTATDGPIDIADGGVLSYINKPELFGGKKKEGGIQGPLYVYNGAADQELQPRLDAGVDLTDPWAIFKGDAPTRYLPSIAESLGGDVPSFRGVTTIWFDGMVCAMNPYPKEWSFRVRRSTAGWYNDDPWYPAKARIRMQSENGKVIHAMNAAHILYEVNTNPEWGRGMPASLIDENSFIQAANTLCDEGFGLCIPWFRRETIKEFIPVIIDHIGAAMYVDRETGKMTLRLIRGDYDVNDLPLYTVDTGLLDITQDDASTEETAYNEIIVTGFDPTTKEDIEVRVHNLASIQSQGEIISNSIEYRGLPTRTLVARVAQRELKAQLPLRKMSVVLDRRGWRITPGMPFRISMPSKGIGEMVVRAGECRDGTLTDGKITIKVVQDIFGMPETAFVEPPSSVWQPPDFTAEPPAASRMYEVNWRDFYRATTATDQATVAEGDSYVALLAKPPVGIQTTGFDVHIRGAGEDYSVDEYPTVGFTNWLTLLADIGPLDTTLTVKNENIDEFMMEFVENSAVLIDDEQIEFVSFDEDTRTATVERGVADTIPAAHAANAVIWYIDDELGSDGKEYVDGETVYGKATTRTSSDAQDITTATEVSLVVDQRVFRPYPPGNLKVDGVSVYLLEEAEHPEPVLTWAHRDRILQGDTLIGHTDGSVGPEAGQTYTVRVYANDGTTLLGTHDMGSGATWTYTTALQGADGSPARVWMEVESVRDEIISMFHYRFAVVLKAGWGYGWGNNWGGA